MLTTDASLTGWGAVLDGRPAQGIWRGHLLDWHINCLEMMALFLALKYFLQELRGYHVLVRINHQGGLRSRRLNRLAQQVLHWAQDKFLSLRAIYIPGHINVGADLLSRQAVRHGEWKLHPEIAALCFRESWQGPSTGVSPLTVSAPLADQNMILRSNIPPWRLAMGGPGQERSPISGTGDSISSKARALEPPCLAPEGDQLRDAGLPPDIVETILSARAPSTARSYASMAHFENWCMAHHVDPVHCQVVSVLEFLQEKLSSGTCPGTLRVYVAAISACPVLIDEVSVGKHPLVARFIQVSGWGRPPEWQPLVLDHPVSPTFSVCGKQPRTRRGQQTCPVWKHNESVLLLHRLCNAHGPHTHRRRSMCETGVNVDHGSNRSTTANSEYICAV